MSFDMLMWLITGLWVVTLLGGFGAGRAWERLKTSEGSARGAFRALFNLGD